MNTIRGEWRPLIVWQCKTIPVYSKSKIWIRRAAAELAKAGLRSGSEMIGSVIDKICHGLHLFEWTVPVSKSEMVGKKNKEVQTILYRFS
jgi:hypothetical protein